jgi:hypothetical protein
MNRELEALIKAYDAAIQAQEAEAERLAALFESKLGATLERHPNLSRETLAAMIRLAHGRWVKAPQRFPSLPPEA